MRPDEMNKFPLFLSVASILALFFVVLMAYVGSPIKEPISTGIIWLSIIVGSISFPFIAKK